MTATLPDRETTSQKVSLFAAGGSNDAITGSRDNDFIFGGQGSDVLKGGDGSDLVAGGAENDRLSGGFGRNFLVGGDGEDTVFYTSTNNTGVHLNLTVAPDMTGSFKEPILEIRSSNVTIDRLSQVERVELTDRPDTIYVDATALKAKVTIDMGASQRQDAPKTNLDVLDLSAISEGVTYNDGRINLGTGTFTQLGSDLGFNKKFVVKGADKIILTNQRDVLINADPGSIVYTGGGRDDIRICNNVGIADLSAEDRITIGGAIEFHGGIRYKWSESEWAVSYGGLFRSGTNQYGELVVRVPILGTMYVLNWQDSGGMGTPFEQRPGHISLFEYDMAVYRLLDPNKPSNMTQMGTWEFMGALVKATFGVEIWAGLDPLTLDLDGDGIELTNASTVSPRFDFDGDLYAERVAWVRPDDGMLHVVIAHRMLAQSTGQQLDFEQPDLHGLVAAGCDGEIGVRLGPRQRCRVNRQLQPGVLPAERMDLPVHNGWRAVRGEDDHVRNGADFRVRVSEDQTSLRNEPLRSP